MGAPLKIWLTLFCYGDIKPQTVVAVFEEITACHDGVIWQVDIRSNDAAIDRQRAQAAASMLSGLDARDGQPFDVHIHVDRDIQFQRGDLVHLARAAVERKGVVAALVSQKGFGKGFGSRLPEGAKGVIGEETIVAMTGASLVGGALMAVHRSVYERLRETVPIVNTGFWPFFTPDPCWYNEGRKFSEYMSEDWAFHQRCRDADIPVFTSFKPITVHWGEHGYTQADGMPSLGGEK